MVVRKEVKTIEKEFICTTDDHIPGLNFDAIRKVEGYDIYVAPEDINKFKIIAHAPDHKYCTYGNLKAGCYRFPCAMNQLIENAIQIGADAIINIEYKINEHPKTNEKRIIVWGTAVKTKQ